MERVTFLNPNTCGIYKEGGTKYKIDPSTGMRTSEIDDELNEHTDLWLRGGEPPGLSCVPLEEVFDKRILVPRYYDQRWTEGYKRLLRKHGLDSMKLGELEDKGFISVRGGHGSPSNDVRQGEIPYIKVSDLRALRVNVNPTNLVPIAVAERLWKGKESGLRAWDLITPNRASSNIGEFVILLPGEERIVLTKEVFVIRVLEEAESAGLDAFYLFWALCLREVRPQWNRVALMQTNREDVGLRYREIEIPKPPDPTWARKVSEPFRTYFKGIARAKTDFHNQLLQSGFNYVAAAYQESISS